MARTIESVKDQRAKLMIEVNQILTADNVDAEARTKANKMLEDVNVLDGDIANLERVAAFEVEQRKFTPSPRPVPGASAEQSPEERKKFINGAFRQYAVHGFNSLNAEQRDLLTTSDAVGGALIPQEFLGSLVEAQKFYGPIAQKVRQKVTDNDGRPMKISYANDTANGLVLLGTEGSTAPAETDPTFVSKILGVDTVTGGLVKVSFQELEDSAFDLDTWLRASFGKRYGRGIEHAITLGVDYAGTTLPNQATGGLVAAATVAQTTSALANGIAPVVARGTRCESAKALPAHAKGQSFSISIKPSFPTPIYGVWYAVLPAR